MGERLNIEIMDNEGETLANGYYHWSALSEDALRKAMPIFLYLKTRTLKTLGVQEAVELLQLTGAEIVDEDKEALSNLGVCRKTEGTNRVRGLISISPAEMFKTREWEGGRINIYPLRKTFDYLVGEEEVEDTGFPFIDVPIDDIDDIPVYKAEVLYERVKRACREGKMLRTRRNNLFNLIY